MKDKKSEIIDQIPLVNEVSASMLADACVRDPQLRDDLRSDAKRSVETLMDGQSLGDISVSAVQNTEDTVYVPLPCYRRLSAEELSAKLTDEQMRAISGGEVVTVVTLVGMLFGGLVVAGAAVGISAAVRSKRRE